MCILEPWWYLVLLLSQQCSLQTQDFRNVQIVLTEGVETRGDVVHDHAQEDQAEPQEVQDSLGDGACETGTTHTQHEYTKHLNRWQVCVTFLFVLVLGIFFLV